MDTCVKVCKRNIMYTSTHKHVHGLVFSRFLDLRGNLGSVKENRLEKLVSPVK